MSAARLQPLEGGAVRVSGELSFETVPGLWREAAALLAEAQGDLAFDLQAVERTDSAGVALLVEWLRAAAERGLAIQFRNIPAQLLDIARVSGVEELLSPASV